MFVFSSMVIINLKCNWIVSFDIKWNLTLFYANFSEFNLLIIRFEMTFIFSPCFGKIHGKVYAIQQLRIWKQKWVFPFVVTLAISPKVVLSQSVLLCSCEEDAWKLRPIFKVAFPIFYFGAYVSQSKAKSAFTDSIARAMLTDLWWWYPHASAGWLCGGGPASHASWCRSMPGVVFF